MTTGLARFEGTQSARTRAWATMSEADLRRTAMQAASRRDRNTLWALEEAFIVLHGRAGAHVSEHTLRNYRTGLRVLLEHFEDENVLRPGRDAALRYVRELEDEGLAPGTIAVRLAAAKMLYRALRWARATEAVPFENVKAPRDPTPPEEKRDAYTAEEVDAMLAKAGPADAALVLLGAHGGLRISETLALTWSDIDLAGERFEVRSGKGRKARSVRMSAALVDALQAYRGSGARPLTVADGLVFRFRSSTRARQRMRRLCKRALVPYRGLHALRHFCGTALYRISGDLRVPARHLGHANTVTTSVYAKMDVRRVDEAVAQL